MLYNKLKMRTINCTNKSVTILDYLGDWKNVYNFPPNHWLYLAYVVPLRSTPELDDESTKAS